MVIFNLAGSIFWQGLIFEAASSSTHVLAIEPEKFGKKYWKKYLFIYLFKKNPKFNLPKITSEAWSSKFSAMAILAINFFISSIAQCCRIQFLVAGFAGTTLFMVQPIFTCHNFLQDIIWIHIRDYIFLFRLNYNFSLNKYFFQRKGTPTDVYSF